MTSGGKIKFNGIKLDLKGHVAAFFDGNDEVFRLALPESAGYGDTVLIDGFRGEIPVVFKTR